MYLRCREELGMRKVSFLQSVAVIMPFLGARKANHELSNWSYMFRKARQHDSAKIGNAEDCTSMNTVDWIESTELC